LNKYALFVLYCFSINSANGCTTNTFFPSNALGYVDSDQKGSNR
jgi:hypothetical protein